MKHITYVFSGNRKNRYLDNNFEAREFFYGLDIFEKEEYMLEIIEPETSKSFIKKILSLIDKIFKKILSLPVYMYEFLSIKNIKILMKTDKLILVNETTFCSLAPFLLLLKLFKKIDVYVFVMGLYSKKLRYKRIEKLHYFIIRVFNLSVTNLMFLGQGELDRAKKVDKKNSSKFILFPFCVDAEFWKLSKNINLSERKEILFVGNDGNRNPELFLEIVARFKNIQFRAVTNIEEILLSDLPNLKVIKGSFGSKDLSDSDLKKIYNNSRLVLLPLKKSFQPSGQSVALQAMSCNRSVIISKTDGFWDPYNFSNNRDIFFVEENNLEGWASVIEKVYYDDSLISKVENSGNNLVTDVYNLNEFQRKLSKILKL